MVYGIKRKQEKPDDLSNWENKHRCGVGENRREGSEER